MLTIANKGRYMVKKCQKHVYVICEGSLSVQDVAKHSHFPASKQKIGTLNGLYDIASERGLFLTNPVKVSNQYKCINESQQNWPLSTF